MSARKPYHRPMPADWFLMRRGYRMFILRELTSVFIAGYLIILLVFLCRLGAGQEAFVALLGTLAHPLWMIVHALVFLGATWHAITWFNVTPQAMPVRIGEKRVGHHAVAAMMGYVPWAVISIVILVALWPRG